VSSFAFDVFDARLMKAQKARASTPRLPLPVRHSSSQADMQAKCIGLVEGVGTLFEPESVALVCIGAAVVV